MPATRAGARTSIEVSRQAIWGPEPLRAHERLVTQAMALGTRDAALASVLLADAARAALVGGEPARALVTSRRSRELARRAGGRAARIGELKHALVVLGAGRGRSTRAALARIDRFRDADAASTAELMLQSGTVLYWAEDYTAAQRLLERAIDRARASRAPLLAVALDTLAAVLFRTGEWPAADGLSAEALRIALRRRVSFDTASAATTLARIAAARGREADCRALLATARRIAPQRSLAAAYAASAAGLLELSLGHADAAIRELEPLAGYERGDEISPIVNQWHPELIEAYIRAGRTKDAQASLARLEAAVGSTRHALLRAAVSRCRGLLAGPNAFDLHFAEALRWHGPASVPFERARTELCYGERLRRARRRKDSVPRLRAALETFERIGAAPWAERARGELGALGRAAREPAAAISRLTSHELAVARLVQRGATNREVAAALFVTPKTVEYHLAAIYRKMAVRSRTELVIALFRAEPGAF